MTTERHTRRSFLRGDSAHHQPHFAADAASGVHDETGSLETAKSAARTPLEAGRSSLVVSVRRRAMACEFEVQLAAARDDDSMEHVFAALDLVESIETQLTTYRDDSEVIRINARAADRPVEIEPQLFGLFRQAQRLHLETVGALDITSGPLSEAWGFSRREGRIPSDDAIQAALDRVGMQHVKLDEATRQVKFDRPSVGVNFNSMGKGYALDRMAQLLGEHNVDDYLLHGGKSSVLARGKQPGCHGDGWTIGLRHPLRPGERLAEFELRNEALSTSGSGTQFFIRRGRRYGHILDPRTGHPAEGLFSATVIAPTATEAEGLSTAFYVMGPEETRAYCAKHPQISALLVAPAKREGEVELFTFGFEGRQWQPISGNGSI